MGVKPRPREELVDPNGNTTVYQITLNTVSYKWGISRILINFFFFFFLFELIMFIFVFFFVSKQCFRIGN